MRMNIKISVVIVTYNSSRTISRLLDSIKKYPKYIGEVIIIDNDSQDKLLTKKKCETYKKFVKLKLINSQNVGFGRSCNLGASRAINNLILFLNPDTEINKDSLETLISHMARDGADIIGGKAINYRKEPHGAAVRKPTLLTGLFEFSNLGKLLKVAVGHKRFYYEDISILKSKIDRQVDAVSGAYLLITKDAFSKLQGFDQNIFMYLEDVDLGVRANEYQLKVFFCPHSIIWHEGGASSNNKYRINHQAWFDSRKYYFKKHFGFFTNLVIQPLYLVEEFLLKKLRNI